MTIETERLVLVPLIVNQLKLWIENIPNQNGVVEIGYGIGEQFEHNGYMTETVKAMCKWAFEHEKVYTVIAETDLDGFASQHILTRCGFKHYKKVSLFGGD